MPRNPSSAHNRSYSRTRAAGVALACACAGAAAAPGAAGAQTGGGAQFEETPVVKKVACVKACAKRKRPRAGSTLRLRGSGLSGVTTVTFQGAPGRDDDAKAAVTRKSAAQRLGRGARRRRLRPAGGRQPDRPRLQGLEPSSRCCPRPRPARTRR